jgi:integrase
MTNIFVSALAPDINAMLDYREALGYLRKSHEARLKSLDRFCAGFYPEADTLTREIVIGWLEEQHGGIVQKATTARLLGNYTRAIGKDAYVLYQAYMKEPTRRSAYVFTDGELAALFREVDTMKPTNKEPFLHEIAPVLYRLIYTCGLRPNEGRELKRENISFKTGEILITNTKWKKERMIVMSGDMLTMCRAYDRRREIFARGSEYFFPSWENEAPFREYQLGCYLRAAWKRANPKVENSELPNIRVYDLRHRFASAALIRWLDFGQPLGAKLSYLCAYMGHNSLSETAYYIHLLPENLVKSAGIDWAAFDEMIPEVISWEE